MSATVPNDPRSQPNREDIVQMAKLLRGFAVTQVIGTAVRNGIPTVLSEEPKSLDEIGQSVPIQRSALRDVLEVLVGLDIVRKAGLNRYASTALLRTLEAAEGAMYGQALMSTAEYYKAWSEIDVAVGSGNSGFERAHGCGLWDYMGEHEDTAANFARTMGANSSVALPAVLEGYEFPHEGVVVDIGAGDGTLLAGVLEGNPMLVGVAVELSAMQPYLHATTQRHHLEDRLQAWEGNLFGALPTNGTLYVVKSVLHNWNHVKLEEALKNIYDKMPLGARLLVIERGMPESTDINAALNNLTMLVLFGSFDRTKDEYTNALKRTGFTEVRSRVDDKGIFLIEGLR